MKSQSAALAILVALASCGGESPAPTAEPASFIPRHGSPLGVGDAALLEGQPVYEDGCLWIVAADGTRFLALWPADTTLGMINSLPAILGPEQGVLVETGSLASLGGSATTRANAEELVGPIPDRCAGDAFWVVSTVENPPSGRPGG